MKKTFLLVAVMAMMAMGVYADSPAKVPAYRGLIERVQPNGDTLRTYLRGDENSHFMADRRNQKRMVEIRETEP